MVNNTLRQTGKRDTLHHNAADLKRTSELRTNSSTQVNENVRQDDLIGTLAEAYENKRERQVFEWECIRRMSIRPAARTSRNDI